MKTTSKFCNILATAGLLLFPTRNDQAAKFTVDVEIHSLACRPPVTTIVFRRPPSLLGGFPTLRAGISRPSYETPMLIILAMLGYIDSASFIHVTITCPVPR